MNIAIIGGQIKHYPILNQKLNELIEEKQIYLFNVICGGSSMTQYTPGLSEYWAKQNGAPIRYIFDEDFNKLQKKIIAAADYIFFLLKDEQWIKNFMMSYKTTGKHGTVIRIGD